MNDSENKGSGAASPTGTEPSGIEASHQELWVEAEKIAMHFNELIIRFRTQALGLVSVSGGIVGTVLTIKGPPANIHWNALGLTLVSLLLIWWAICWIDFGYYTQLLKGSVFWLLEFEKRHPDLGMSRTIEATVRDWRPFFAPDKKCTRPGPAQGFYVLVSLALLIPAACSFYKASQDAPPSCQAPALPVTSPSSQPDP